MAGTVVPCAGATILKRLDFESGSLRQWTEIQAVPGRVSIVRSPVRQGHFAARFVVKPGDRPIGGGERAELYASAGERAGVESWWKWSTYFPTGFRPNRNSNFNIFTQWHHSGTSCTPPVRFDVDTSRSPIKLKLRVWGGRLDENTCGASYQRVWTIANLRRNHWYNFRFHVKWSDSRTVGFVRLSINGRVRVPKTHTATLYRGQSVYVKQGFYRGSSSLTSTLFHDGLVRYRP
jgi:hypothetical protein